MASFTNTNNYLYAITFDNITKEYDIIYASDIQNVINSNMIYQYISNVFVTYFIHKNKFIDVPKKYNWASYSVLNKKSFFKHSLRVSIIQNIKNTIICVDPYVSIEVNNIKYNLYSSDNQYKNYEKSIKLFMLFDDKNKDNVDNIIEFSKENPDYQLCFYAQDDLECEFDVFALSAYLKRLDIYELLLPIHNYKLDYHYIYGMGTYTTPRNLILGNYEPILEQDEDEEDIIGDCVAFCNNKPNPRENKYKDQDFEQNQNELNENGETNFQANIRECINFINGK